ncbi:hypothetical protein [Providencia alcalifaciens]|uniref:hypothetical protein n=1 Tax=Providencia alcalifaciens TaxID=126385 RepID=UPI00055B7D97
MTANNAYASGIETIGCYTYQPAKTRLNHKVNSTLHLTFKFNHELNLPISSWQELYACEGAYMLKETPIDLKASILHAQDCKIPSPQFILRKKINTYLIKSTTLKNSPVFQLVECTIA